MRKSHIPIGMRIERIVEWEYPNNKTARCLVRAAAIPLKKTIVAILLDTKELDTSSSPDALENDFWGAVDAVRALSPIAELKDVFQITLLTKFENSAAFMLLQDAYERREAVGGYGWRQITPEHVDIVLEELDLSAT